jgi:hypothetical protein
MHDSLFLSMAVASGSFPGAIVALRGFPRPDWPLMGVERRQSEHQTGCRRQFELVSPVRAALGEGQ